MPLRKGRGCYLPEIKGKAPIKAHYRFYIGLNILKQRRGAMKWLRSCHGNSGLVDDYWTTGDFRIYPQGPLGIFGCIRHFSTIEH